jgi:signal transduction histidine kinase
MDPVHAVVATLGYVSFQVFTVLMVNYTKRAQQTRNEVLRINAELLATRQLLLEGARDEERLRISRELHDLVGHKLTALKLQLHLRARQSADNAACRTLDDECVRLSDELLSDVRGVVSTLREGDGIDLHRALEALIPAVPQPRIELKLEANALVPGLQQAHTLLRCAQESLTNALRHSGATLVILRLERSRGGVALTVEDDGCARSLPNAGNGLTGMRERLQALDGTLQLTVNCDHGLRVAAWLPQADAGLNA